MPRSSKPHNFTDEKQEAKAFRKYIDLRPMKPGTRLCLKCARDFRSEDLWTIRMCYHCKNWYKEGKGL